ncbi:MAG: hypothetical protein ACI9U2_001999 [Bradymonadia bacterium]|jgi:hypothetical protein
MAEIGSRIGGFMDRLSTREKLMVGSLVTGLVATAVVIIWLVVGGQIDELEQENTTLAETLAQVEARKGTYLTAQNRLDAYQARLDRNSVKLVQLMEEQAQTLGVTIENFKESKRFLTDKHKRMKRTATRTKVKDLVEESQTVTMRRISLEQLTQFMSALEGRTEPIRVTQLNIQTLTSDRQVLRQVKMTVSTYRNEEVEL